MKNILNFLLFQITWFVCVWSVGQGIPYWGLLFVLGVLLFHFIWTVTHRMTVTGKTPLTGITPLTQKESYEIISTGTNSGIADGA